MKKVIYSFLIVFMGMVFSCQMEQQKDNQTLAESNKPEKEVKTETKKLPDDVYYPEDYRSWTHVKSMILEEGHPLYESFGGIHHLYANQEAMQGYKNNHKFPDGSVIVFDLLEHISQDNAITEGERKVIGIMYKNSSVFAETGGWGFGAFKNQNGERLVIDGKSACFSCHASQKDRDYVFSDYRP